MKLYTIWYTNSEMSMFLSHYYLFQLSGKKHSDSFLWLQQNDKLPYSNDYVYEIFIYEEFIVKKGLR